VKPAVVLATLGSLGDLHPFMALGLALRARGAAVTLACAAEYRAKVERAGLAFRPLRPSFADIQLALGMDRAELTDAVLARQDFLLRRLIMPHVRESYEDMLEIVAGADLILTSSLAFGARLAAERRAIPWLGIVLQPLMFLSAYDPPEIPRAQWLTALLRRLGPGPTRWAMRVIKHAFGAQLRPVHALRAAIGLPALRINPLFDGQFSALGAIGLYSPLLAAAQPDYPQPTAIVGFASYDSDDGAPSSLEPSLEEFLAAGPRPLVFTLGSLIVHSPGSFYRESVLAAQRLGLRAVLVVGENGIAEYAGLASAGVHVCAYAPHSLLFPRAAANVHQGGIGTLAQALRSGRPQLIVPFYADQLDNAVRAGKLGVARWVAPAVYDCESACRELGALIGTADYAARAEGLGRMLAAEDGAARGAEVVLERLRAAEDGAARRAEVVLERLRAAEDGAARGAEVVLEGLGAAEDGASRRAEVVPERLASRRPP
jgi:UDP:flavonoid glycosyltransferase YjiC (YdhE family)